MRKETLLKYIKQNPFFLAPMAGVTDSPFRSLMREMGCGILTTELISAKSLSMGHHTTGYDKSRKLMSFTENQKPIGVQLFGEDLSALQTAAQIVDQTGADFIDLNFGCPVTKIIKKGAGSAMLKDLKFLRKVLKTVCQSTCLPVSIKIRTGWNMDSRNSHQVAQIAADVGIIWLTIHGRTRSQGYSGQADWSYIAEVKAKSPIPVIGNGDLIHPHQIIKLQNQSKCDGMMIGRACLKNPWIFIETINQHQSQKNNAPSSSKVPLQKNIFSVLNRLQYHLENFYDEKMFLLQYKKFCAWFSTGFPHSAQFRKSIFQTSTKTQVLDTALAGFQTMVPHCSKRQNTHYESSLMQGHG